MLLRGHGRADDGAGNLVEADLDLRKGLLGVAVLTLDEMIESAGQRAHLVFQRADRQRFREVGDRLTYQLDALRKRRQFLGVGRASRAGGDAVLEIVEAAAEIVPAAVDGQHRLLARQRVERRLHLFDFQPQHVDGAVVAALAERLDCVRQALHVEAELAGGMAARCVDLLEFLAKPVEFAVQARRHLMAQFLAQALQFAGDLAEGGDAVLFVAHALYVARDRLVGLLESAARFLCITPGQGGLGSVGLRSVGLPRAGLREDRRRVQVGARALFRDRSTLRLRAEA